VIYFKFSGTDLDVFDQNDFDSTVAPCNKVNIHPIRTCPPLIACDGAFPKSVPAVQYNQVTLKADLELLILEQGKGFTPESKSKWEDKCIIPSYIDGRGLGEYIYGYYPRSNT
jgi:hypothetical protein